MHLITVNNLQKPFAKWTMFNLELWEISSSQKDVRFLLDLSSFCRDDLLPIAYRFLRRKGVKNYHLRLTTYLDKARDVVFEKFSMED